MRNMHGRKEIWNLHAVEVKLSRFKFL